MFAVESYAAVRRFVFVEGHSRREAARVFGLNRETVAKMCRFSLPPGYTRKEPAAIDRERRTIERRIRAAQFPAVKSFDTFEFAAIPGLNKMLVLELARCEYILRR